MILKLITKMKVINYLNITMIIVKFHVFVFIFHNIKINKNNILFYICHIYNKT